MNRTGALPASLFVACRRWHVRPTPDLLVVSVARQVVEWWRAPSTNSLTRTTGPAGRYVLHRCFRASTSRFGIGQVRDTNRTPLGLHRIAQKLGGGWPVGAVFQARRMVGYVWKGLPQATIAHRILWLEGLEPGLNQGGDVDTRRRFIYLHGLADEPTLGRPASHGCVHLAAADLLPLYDRLPVRSLVWITAGP